MGADALITEYLGRLRAASWPLPPGRRDELQAEVAEHIEAALAASGTRDEVTVRNILDRLGPPEDIAAAEGREGGAAGSALPNSAASAAASAANAAASAATAAAAAIAKSPWGAMEILAVLFLTAGAILLPVIGPVVGLVFAWGSRQWTTNEKAIATAIVLGILMVPVLGIATARIGF